MDSLLALTWLYLGLMLVAAFLHHARRARLLGQLFAEERSGVLRLTFGTLVLLGVLGYAALKTPELLSSEALPTASLLLAVLWLAPRRATRACGTQGVQVGWSLVPLTALVEWRLTGDHLRVRWDETWRSVRVPNGIHAPLRECLEEQAPGRESPFR